jgi:hypothetical protein
MVRVYHPINMKNMKNIKMKKFKNEKKFCLLEIV